MGSKNCWEVKKCGREPGGNRVKELGVCPAALETRTHGINGGTNGGRACWAIAGTFCGGKPQGSYAQKMEGCFKCEFYLSVLEEEYPNYMGTVEILKKLQS